MSEKKPINILAVFGTRPDAVKMAPVVQDLRKFPDKVALSVAVSGQHREMLDQVLDVFDIKPDFDLQIMREKQSLASITCRCLEGLEKVFEEVNPKMVLAQGDTTTTFAASLAAFYHKIPFGHVEAGLRTDNKYNPFPEEMNRRLTTVLGDLHFAPTEMARRNLLKDGIPDEKIYVTGNTVIDALLTVAKKQYKFDDSEIENAFDKGSRVILVTAHRRENWGEPIQSICEAIATIVKRHPDVKVVFPVHKNPIVREVVYPALEGVNRVYLTEPPDYVPFVHMMKRSYLILTDSGGVQEEAPSLGKPVLILRETTERPEAVEAGSARLIGTKKKDIVAEVESLLASRTQYDRMSEVKSPFGDGSAARRIREAIFEYFKI
ncbi:MAG: UDP-N-acetylglucosamine 2-epimerase (non-hydrolyzing) [Armatimonadota bacterium]|nr:UDP-N-acetylglucosamine 2-epimerase (non-hydrolyzing) [Armatimonadota bacterium]